MMESSESPEDSLPDFIGRSLRRSRHKDKIPDPGKFVVLVGLDGAGKTTFARCVSEQIVKFPEIPGLRYFHWIPKLTGFDFPLPDLAETPRKEQESGFVAGATSVARLIRNLIMARISYHIRVQPLVRKGFLVMTDRFVYNYWIDPVSLRYSGPRWCIDLAGRVFPKPDILISLEAGTDILLSRKQELNRDQIDTMRDRIRTIPVSRDSFVTLDASSTPQVLVDEFMRLISKKTPSPPKT